MLAVYKRSSRLLVQFYVTLLYHRLSSCSSSSFRTNILPVMPKWASLLPSEQVAKYSLPKTKASVNPWATAGHRLQMTRELCKVLYAAHLRRCAEQAAGSCCLHFEPAKICGCVFKFRSEPNAVMAPGRHRLAHTHLCSPLYLKHETFGGYQISSHSDSVCWARVQDGCTHSAYQGKTSVWGRSSLGMSFLAWKVSCLIPDVSQGVSRCVGSVLTWQLRLWTKMIGVSSTRVESFTFIIAPNPCRNVTVFFTWVMSVRFK